MQDISELLSPRRTLCRLQCTSIKKLFEIAADILGAKQPTLTADDIFAHLLAREKLGSTGIGHGVAIPHFRVSDCPRPLGALTTLETPLDFDAPDDVGVDIFFILMVPEDGQQAHLDTLAAIARLFSQDAFCAEVRAAATDEQLYRVATTWSGSG